MRTILGFFRFIATLLFVLAIPLIIFTSNLRWILLDASFYDKGQAKHKAVQTTGLEQRQLQGSNRALVSYFASPDDDLASELRKQGLPASLFNQREVVHLSDVRALVKMVFTVQLLVVGYGVVFLLGSFALGRKRFLGSFARRLLIGAVLTVVVLGVFGALAVVDWSQIFLMFHLVSFSNDFWQLNPSTDYLIRMFPPTFFFDASVTLAGISVAQSIALALLAAVVLFWEKRRRKLQQA